MPLHGMKYSTYFKFVFSTFLNTFRPKDPVELTIGTSSTISHLDLKAHQLASITTPYEKVSHVYFQLQIDTT